MKREIERKEREDGIQISIFPRGDSRWLGNQTIIISRSELFNLPFGFLILPLKTDIQSLMEGEIQFLDSSTKTKERLSPSMTPLQAHSTCGAST